jgi:polysaccharide biosynthesis/export protein
MIVTLFLGALALVQDPSAAAISLSTYTLGSDDQIVIRVLNVEEIDNKPVRIDNRGIINLPMIGKMQAAGLTTDQLELEITTRLKKYVVAPDVTVSVLEMRSQPVSILGQVGTPGVHQLQGQKNLFEVLSVAGGLKPDAGNSIKITRRLEWGRIPLPSAANDATGKFSVASVPVRSILAATNPADNISIKPNDVISVPKADIVYAIGAIKKSGGFVLGDNASPTALQLLSMAEGLDRMAAGNRAKIMRIVPESTTRSEIALDLKAILSGKAPDVPLQPEDILFVPVNNAKNAAIRTMEAAIGVGTSVTTGLIIYR